MLLLFQLFVVVVVVGLGEALDWLPGAVGGQASAGCAFPEVG
jgi:hypothetical protein